MPRSSSKLLRNPATEKAWQGVPPTKISGAYAAGRQLKVEIKQMGNRSYQHHKLFFGGLLPLAYEYWVPSGGLVTDGEQKLISGFARRLEAMHSSGGLFLEFADEFVRMVAAKRGEKIGAVLQSMEAFRKWLTIEAGYFDVYETPDGYRKEPPALPQQTDAKMSLRLSDGLARHAPDMAEQAIARPKMEAVLGLLESCKDYAEFEAKLSELDLGKGDNLLIQRLVSDGLSAWADGADDGWD